MQRLSRNVVKLSQTVTFDFNVTTFMILAFSCTPLEKVRQSGLIEQEVLLPNIECFMSTFPHIHSWLNWVDEDDLLGGGSLERKDTRYIKITSK